ncbi:MAG: NUDIX domain-containing protein [Gammaproteobacteria bacterium]|nr:NUDIX domain-containing protein [Gammaproteobacteria bacterium]
MHLQSAGILLYRFNGGQLQVLLVHPGGPLWYGKDQGAWSIPKGLIEANEPPLTAARREFKEETGFDADGEFIELGHLKQPSKKIVYAWALEKDVDPEKIISNEFDLEWPRHSGRVNRYPEIDKGEWFDLDEAKQKIAKGQAAFLDILVQKIGYDSSA